jgi:hypothetical protein
MSIFNWVGDTDILRNDAFLYSLAQGLKYRQRWINFTLGNKRTSTVPIRLTRIGISHLVALLDFV